jgi:hypothetical protein
VKTRVYFEGTKVIDRVRTGEVKALTKESAEVRKNARRSIRKRKRASAPGMPPSSHIGRLKNLIYFAIERNRQVGAVIGPTLWGNPRGSDTVPHILEYGGTAVSNGHRRERKIGGVGIIYIGNSPTSKTVKAPNGTVYHVRFGKIRTSSQLARVNANETQIYGPLRPHKIQVFARPYMGPALNAALSRHADFWRDCIK